MLTEEMVKSYHDEGLLHPVEIFDEEEIRSYRQQFEALARREGQEKSTFSLQHYHLKEQFVWEMVTNPKILDIVQQLMGEEDILLYNSRFVCKYPVKEAKMRFFSWHQDIAYCGLQPDNNVHVVWIAIDDSDVENGCMRVLPHSHKRGVVRHQLTAENGSFLRVNQEIPPQLVDEEKAVFVEQKAGTISVHDGRLFHASNQNLSQRRRCGLLASFISPKLTQSAENVDQPIPDGYKWRPLQVIEVRGRDRYGHFNRIEAPFPLTEPKR